MSLASLTVDLSLGLAKFEADSGKAAQIVTRDMDANARAAKKFEDGLIRMSNAAARVGPEFQIAQAAALGLGDSTVNLIKSLAAGGASFGNIGSRGAAAFAGIAGAAQQAGTESEKRIAAIVSSLREAKAKADALRASVQSENASGSLNEDGLKAKLKGIRDTETAFKELAFSGIQREQAAERVAQAERASAEVQRVSAQKIVDAQNGLTASYRQQLAALRELRDAGALTPAQFKQAGAELVGKQPVVKDRADQEAAVAATARIAAANALLAAQAGATEAATSAQSRVFLAFKVAELASIEQASASQSREASVIASVAAASDRSRVAQEAAYATKTAYIASVNEETAALFRSKEAQRALDATRAGVGSQQAAQLAKLQGDREFISSIYQQIAAEQKKGTEFGKSATEILRQDAALRGLTNTTASAISRFDALATANQAASQGAVKAKSDNAYIAGLERQIAVSGKARSEIVALELAQLGLAERGAPLLAKLRDIDAATGQLGKQAFGTRNQLLTLKYTLSDIVSSAASGISPLTILLQQGPQVAQIEGGIGGVFRTVVSLITPFRLAVGGAAAAIGLFGSALFEGQKQSKAFADSLVLTGNYAGITEGQFNSLAKGIAASGQISISSAREFSQALIATGEIGPKNLDKAAEAAARYGAATGKSAKDVAAEFATLNNDVSAGATRLNQSLNFLTAAQLQQIRTLQEQGNAADALGIIYDALNTRLAKLEPNLGTLDRILRGVSVTWKGFWDAALDLGRAETIEQKLAKVQARLADVRGEAPASYPPVQFGKTTLPRLDIRQPPSGSFGAYKFPSQPPAPELPPVKFGAYTFPDNRRSALEAEEAQLKQEIAVQKTTASTVAAAAATTKLAQAGRANIEALLVQGKFTGEYDKAVLKLNRDLAENVKAGTPFTAKEEASARAQLKKKFTDSSGINDADAQRKAKLDQDLKFLKDNLQQEQAALQFHQQFVQGVYAAGNLSLTEYYAERRKLTADGVQGELNQLIDEQARLEVELENGGFKNEAERTGVQTKRNEARAASANLALKAQRDAILAGLEEAAAVKALSDRVVEYRANLLQLAGDDAGAARLRTAQTIAAAQLLAKQPAGSQSPIDEQSVLLQRDLADAADAYAEAQKKIGLFTNLATSAEELFLRTALRTGASLAETERGVSAIRGRSLLLLREQLALLRATAGTDAKKLADVAALATQIEIAADRSNAALNRLRETVQSLGASAAASLSSSLVHFSSLFEKRRDDANKAVQQERDGYDRQIRELESYLAKSFDRKDRARLQDLINQAKAKSAGAGESRDTTRLKTLERDVLAPLVQQATDAVAKLLIEDPLKAYIQGQLKALTEGDGEIAKFLKSFLGIKPGETDPAKIAALETAAALNALTAAATGAAGALAGGGVASTISSGDFARFDRLPAGSTDPAPFNAFLDKLTKTGTAAADNFGSASTSLIASTLKTGSAFGGLPGLLSQFGNGMIQALQTLASASGGGSGGGLGGIASLISSFFSGGNTGTLPTGDFARFDRMPKLAVGTNFVPYDGFKASLHRGEAVVPAKYNPAAGGGFGGSQQGSRPVLVNIVNNGEPVKAKSTQRETSEGTVIDLVLDAVAADMAGGGKVHDATQRRFGLNPGGSTPRN